MDCEKSLRIMCNCTIMRFIDGGYMDELSDDEKNLILRQRIEFMEKINVNKVNGNGYDVMNTNKANNAYVNTNLPYSTDLPKDQKVVSVTVDSNKHNHYFKKCPYESVDIYRILKLFNVTDPCLQHAIKKLMVAGGRGGKGESQDVQEAIDTLQRWKAMRNEEGITT